MTAAPTSEVPSTAERNSEAPAWRRRKIDSSTTMELSTSMPMPRVSPPSDMMLSEMSILYMAMNVAMTEIGIDVAMISVLRRSRRKNSSTMMASTPPISAALRTSSTACWMKWDWSNSTVSSTPGGSLPSCHSARRPRRALATVTVFASPSLYKEISTDSRPFTRVISSRSLLPQVTSATSPRRTRPLASRRRIRFAISSTSSNSFTVRIRNWLSRPRRAPPGRLTLLTPTTCCTWSSVRPRAARRLWSKSIWISSSRPPLI